METAATYPPQVAWRRTVQWIVAPIVVLTVALGWKYPLLGFTVPVAMATGMAGGFFRGRWVCGHLCPRGGFFDRMIAPFAPRRSIPPLLRSMPLRWGVFAALMGFMVWRISADPGNWEHWGRVFWSMCALTTGIGLVAALTIHPRAWCAFCPMGTFQNAVGGGKGPLQIAPSCRECRKCEKACPMALPLVKDKSVGYLQHRDCLKCPECIAVCPANALSWPEDRR